MEFEKVIFQTGVLSFRAGNTARICLPAYRTKHPGLCERMVISMVDILILGAGPAGLAAAIQTIQRGRGCTVIGDEPRFNPLWKSRRVDNYPGMPGVTGRKLLSVMARQAAELGAQMVSGRVQTIMSTPDGFSLLAGDEVYTGKRLILATGAPGKLPPGGEAMLGRGVSTCATCDGRLYRGKHAVVTGDAPDLAEEAVFLAGLGVQITVVAKKAVAGLNSALPFVRSNKITIVGDSRVQGVQTESGLIPCDAVFALYRSAPPALLLPGLTLTPDGFIAADEQGATSLPEVYAAGDCTGRPHQIARAVWQGHAAATAAAADLAR